MTLKTVSPSGMLKDIVDNFDYLQLLAYGGVWYVLGSKNVTLGTAT